MKSIEEVKEEKQLEVQKAEIEKAIGEEIEVQTKLPSQARMIHMILGVLLIATSIFLFDIPYLTYGLIILFIVTGIWILR